MDSVKSTLDMIILLCYIGLLYSMIKMSIGLYRYFKVKQENLRNEIIYRQLEIENKNKTVEYSDKALELIRSIVGQIAVLKFRTFQDGRDMAKVTKTNVEELVKDIANMANGSLNMNNIFLDDTFFTKEFVEKYIVETAVILVKQMMEKTVNNMDNVE